jgi:hypothetical protein
MTSTLTKEDVYGVLSSEGKKEVAFREGQHSPHFIDDASKKFYCNAAKGLVTRLKDSPKGCSPDELETWTKAIKAVRGPRGGRRSRRRRRTKTRKHRRKKKLTRRIRRKRK